MSYETPPWVRARNRIRYVGLRNRGELILEHMVGAVRALNQGREMNAISDEGNMKLPIMKSKRLENAPRKSFGVFQHRKE